MSEPKVEGMRRGLAETSCGYLHYRDRGAGPPVVLLHINQQSSALMLELMAALAPTMRAVAFDYPSHGMSDHLAEQPSIELYADCAVEVMDWLGIDRAAVIGEAVGAATAASLAGRHADRIERAVLVNCPLFVDDATAEHDIADIRDRARPADETGFPRTRTVDFMLEHDPEHAPMDPSQSWMDRINVSQMQAGRDRWQALGALRRFDMLDNLRKIRRPVMLLTGEHFYYGRHRPTIEAAIPEVVSKVVPHGRFCMMWERATEIAQEALNFFGHPNESKRGGLQ